MDADGRIIPIVEDDQGEGYKDEIDPLEDPSYVERIKEMELKANLEARRVAGVIKNIKEPTSEVQKAIKTIQRLQPQPQPQRMKMQLGMPIDFHGYRYKVTKVLNRGRIMLKLLGETPKGR